MVIQVALKNEANESASILDASVLAPHNEYIQRYNPTLRGYLGKYAQSNGALTGSSPLLQVNLQDSGLLPGDARVVTRSELETAISRSTAFLSDTYTDFGLALFTAGDPHKPNDLPSKVLAGQLKHRGIKLGKGKLVPLTVLSLEENANSAYGAVFRLNDKANKDNVLDLRNFKWYSLRSEGMSCASLGRDRRWDAYGSYVGDSVDDGRVAVVSGEATSRKILDNHLTNFRQERDAEIAKIQRQYAEREALLRVE
ncbi:hypothetical protein HYV88_02965 [Candidatus Woesearchaeota archaeon]|nr:hypothetical protein [Candidatus Woesearchaeota archaeon]